MNAQDQQQRALFLQEMQEMRNRSIQAVNRRFQNIDRYEYLRKYREIDSVFRVEKGRVFGMGYTNMCQIVDYDNGQDMIGPTEVNLKAQFVNAGDQFSMALVDGVPYSWGGPDCGSLGRSTVNDDSTPVPEPITGFTNAKNENENGQIVMIAAGSMHSLYLSKSGTVYAAGCFKDQDSGRFAENLDKAEGFNATPTRIPLPDKVRMVKHGENFCVVVTHHDQVLTWGFGGSGDLARSAGMTQPQPDGSYDVSKANYCDEDTGNYKIDVIKTHYLTPSPVMFQNPRVKKEVLDIGTAPSHLLAVCRHPNDPNQYLYTSGLNNAGQLGLGDEINRHQLTWVEALKHENIGQATGGQSFSLVLTKSGKAMYSFGDGQDGQLGIGYLGPREKRNLPVLIRLRKAMHISEIAANGKNCLAITSDGLYAWGSNTTMATGQPQRGDRDIYVPTKVNVEGKVTSISCGQNHGLFVVVQEGNTASFNTVDKKRQAL